MAIAWESRRRRNRVLVIALRASTSAVALLGQTQAVFAGIFLGGDDAMLAIHRATAGVLLGLSVIQAGIMIPLWRTDWAPTWLLRAALLLPVLLGVQAGLGMGEVLAVHVPLGVGIVAASILTVVWVWRAPVPARHPSAPAAVLVNRYGPASQRR